MATEAELYKIATDAGLSPEEAAAKVASYLEMKAQKKPAPVTNAAAKGAFTPPKGGPKGTVTKPAVAPAPKAEPVGAPAAKVAPVVKAVEVSEYLMPGKYGTASPGLARQADEMQVAEDARWAAQNPVTAAYSDFRRAGKSAVELAQRAPLMGDAKRLMRGAQRVGGEVVDALRWQGAHEKAAVDKVGAMMPEVSGPKQVAVQATMNDYMPPVPPPKTAELPPVVPLPPPMTVEQMSGELAKAGMKVPTDMDAEDIVAAYKRYKTR